VYGAVRVLLADPAGFTTPYDHELARALAAAGVEVELATSRFRFGEAPEPIGYVRTELFYPLSSRLFRRSRLRLPLRALEHSLGHARLRRRDADVVHMQWLAAPRLDERLLRFVRPSVLTAHDPLPRRAASRPQAWRRLVERFDRIVVHSEWGRDELARLGVTRDRIRLIPHPVFRSDPEPADDGRTLLCLGVIRPYKGLGDAIEVAKRVGARLIVAGDPLEPVEPYRRAAAGAVDWRLGYLPESELDRVLGEATLALFPYRAELARLDQSGALLRALGGGVPAIAYDAGGIAEPVRRFGAGRVVPPGELDGFIAAVSGLLDDPAALAEARAGAHRAREELTWAAAAAAHLVLYGELV
jgi:glycosyltransferase involved in cell wall biosynthesis